MTTAEGEPTCPHLVACPGCPRLGESYARQLEHKREAVSFVVQRTLSRLEASIEPTRSAAPTLAYRERAKLVVEGCAIGLYRRGSHEVVDLPGCVILDPVVERAVAALRALLAEDTVPGLEGVDAVRVEQGCLVTLIAGADADRARLEALGEQLAAREPLVRGVATSRRKSGAVRLLGGDLEVLRGSVDEPRRLLPSGPYHRVTYGGFAQVHHGSAAALAEEVLSELGLPASGRRHPDTARPRVLELYAGSGGLALNASARGARVLAVEAFAPAAQRLRQAACEQGLALEVEADDAARAVQWLAASNERFQAVVVNPPRRGLDVRVRDGLGVLAPERILYVSCQPPTLARDLAHFSLLGFEVVRLLPFDMIPQTDQVETLAVLSRGSLPPAEVLYEDDALIAVEKRPHESTTPQGERAGSLLSRVRALPGAAAAVPVHRLDVGTSGVILFARKADQVAAIAEGLAQAQKTYVALVRGLTHAKGRIDRPLLEAGRKRQARSRYRRRAVLGGHSLLEVCPEQGRKHQVRRHLASIGHPVLGDARHGDERSNAHFEMKHGLDRTFLHCAEIRLTWRERSLVLTAPLAPDLELVLQSIG